MKGEESKESVRGTVQISDALQDAIEERAHAEALPSASLLRRAITVYVSEWDPEAPPLDLTAFAEQTRRGSRGPLRQWPRGASYVLEAGVAEQLEERARQRSQVLGRKVSGADLAREAIVIDLERPPTPRRPLTRDEHGFTTTRSGGARREMQRQMDEAWKMTNE